MSNGKEYFLANMNKGGTRAADSPPPRTVDGQIER